MDIYYHTFYSFLIFIIKLSETMENNNYKPFKQYREMDDEQKRKISQNANLHKPKPQEVKDKIADTMRKRWAATPSKEVKQQGGTTIDDIML